MLASPTFFSSLSCPGWVEREREVGWGEGGGCWLGWGGYEGKVRAGRGCPGGSDSDRSKPRRNVTYRVTSAGGVQAVSPRWPTVLPASLGSGRVRPERPNPFESGSLSLSCLPHAFHLSSECVERCRGAHVFRISTVQHKAHFLQWYILKFHINR